MSDLDQNSKVGTATDELSQRRRALLKGSAGVVPAILTLRSGSALAATSISCVTKVQSANPAVRPPAIVEDAAVDTWLRQETKCRVLTNTSNLNEEVIVFQDPGNSKKWYKVDTTNSNEAVAFVDDGGNGEIKRKKGNRPRFGGQEPNNIGSGLQMKSNNGNDPFQTYTYTKTKTCYVLVQVGPNGSQPNPKVYGASNAAVLNSESCASSLINQPLNNNIL